MSIRPITRNKRESKLRHTILSAALLAAVPGAALAGPTITYGEEGSLTVSYAVQIWMQQRDFTSATDNGSSLDTFLRRNRLLFAGQYNDLVGFYAQLEAGNDDKQGNADRPVYYRDAYLTLDFADPFRVIVGRFKNTFSRENLEACLEPLTLDRAEVIAYTPFAGTRDTGLAVWGNLANAKLQYRVMMGDGRQGDEVVKDSPRLTGRVHVSLLDPETDYGYHATHLGTRKVLTFGAAYDYQADVAYGNFAAKTDPKNYSAWTVDGMFEYPTASGTYTLSSAYFDYSVDDAINASPDPLLPVNSELRAYYVKGAYLLPDKLGPGRLQFFFRHENSDYAVQTGYYDQQWNGVGANYYLDGQNLKLTFEYADVKFDVQHPTNPALQDYGQATLAFQLIF